MHAHAHMTSTCARKVINKEKIMLMMMMKHTVGMYVTMNQ
jgi:hypothetical protein